jgi:hypothetical protein
MIEIINKIDLPILLILFIIICILLSDKKEGFKEGLSWGDVGRAFEDFGNTIKSGFEKLVDEINNAMNEFVELLKKISPERIAQELRSPFDRLGDLFTKSIRKSKSEFEKSNAKIEGPFRDFFDRMRRVGDGLNNIFLGIGDEFVGIGDGLRLGFEDIGLLLEYTGEYTITHILCFLKFLVSIPLCIFFYLADIFGQLLYLPIRIILFVGYITVNKKIYDIETYIWKQIRAMDYMIYEKIGFFFTRWPKNIRDQCYNCKRLKVSVLQRKANDVNIDFDEKMPRLLGGGVMRMAYGGDEILSAFH